MDIFGIGQAMKGVMNVYFQSSRHTGRTMSMVNSLKDGDRVCFTNQREAERVQHLCKNRGIDIDCMVVSPSNPTGIFERSTSKGRTLMDHSWIEQYYLDVMKQCAKDIDYFEQQSSGYGELHEETKFKAEQLSKWHF